MNKSLAILAINVVILINVAHSITIGTITDVKNHGDMSLEVRSMRSDKELDHAEDLCLTMFSFRVDDANARCIDYNLCRPFAFGAWQGDKLISFVAIIDVVPRLSQTFSSLLKGDNVAKYGHVMNLLTRKEYQRSGIATKFAIMVIKYYIQTHALTKNGIIADVAGDVPGLVRMYERYGLRNIGRREYTVAGNSYSNTIMAAKFEDLLRSLASTSN
ncbi:hypothetical protein DdX_20556 [Ditylenchus destructor]|uniref:N-acetyltransferase domain-containing protein n=1 Tax=Ditylenchus destructor TaxID=166010 RepID=A0AAD4MGZ1_9BILA|nr:hypothetical protein DdX_20556 [Ditylenchus destructor]